MPNTPGSSQNRPGPDSSVGKGALILIGWVVILVCSLILYDALLFSSLRKELEKNACSAAEVAVNSLRAKVVVGVRFGKKLETYRNLDRLLEETADISNLPLAVLDAKGEPVRVEGDFPDFGFAEAELESGDNGISSVTDQQNIILLAPVIGPDGEQAGSIAAAVSRRNLDSDLTFLMGRQIAGQAGMTLVGLVVMALLIRIGMRREKVRTTEAAFGAFRNSCIAVFLLVMGGCGALALHTVSTRYTADLKTNAGRTGAMLTGDLNRLLLVGVSLDRTDQVDAYLAGIAAMHGNALVLEILNPQGERFATSQTADTVPLPDSQTFTLLQKADSPDLSGLDTKEGWRLRVSLIRDFWMDRLVAAALDIATLVFIALVFMVEMLLLLLRWMELKRERKEAIPSGTPTAVDGSALLRPLAFFMMFAIDMSISFIPLRMAQLIPAGTLSRDMLMGLPISAEMGMTGLSVLVAGRWIGNRGPRPPLMVGLTLTALGCLGSVLSAVPWQYVTARAVVGLGYGLTLLTAQACTVRQGRLADMFAGIYAGSLCGSALGAMLAERFGYGSVFLLAAFILFCLVPVARILVNPGRLETQDEASAKITAGQVLRLLGDRRFLAFVLLGLVPSAMLCVGFLNYFLPVYLQDAGTAQSDIGRIYMLNCLLVIYSGPPLTRLVLKARSKAAMVCAAGILSAFSLLGLTFLSPLPAATLGAILIGLATGLNIPAQSEYLLRLDIAQAIGVEQTLSLLDALQRVGQVLGPLCTGAALLLMDVNDLTRWAGAAFIIMSFVFLAVGRPARHSSMQTAGS